MRAAATCSALFALLLASRAAAQTVTPHVMACVDFAAGEVVITAGPFRVQAMDMGMGDMEMGSYQDTVYAFAWPQDGWMQGYRIELKDAQGNPLPRQMIHHIGFNNFARRQAQYPAVERLLAAGKETDDITLPRSIGVPMRQGDSLGLFAMLMPVGGKTVDSAYVTIAMPFTSKGHGHPTDVMPLLIDVHPDIGGYSRYDLPPGHTERSAEFTLALGGGMIAIGGHLHDYAVSVRLEDVKTGKVLVRLKAKKKPDGDLISVSRFNYGFHDDMLRLEGGRRYRIVTEYDNPTGKTITDGAMGMMAGPFVPDFPALWPVLDPNDPVTQRDLASMPRPAAPPAAPGCGARAK
jgi:hypothetical protein